MAIFNEILVGRFNRGLQKLFGVKSSAPVRQVAGEITPVHPLVNGAENRYLEGYFRFASSMNSGLPAAGNRAAVRIRNPAGSNVIATIEKLTLSELTATEIQFIFVDSIATAMPTENQTFSPRNLDTRQQQTGSMCILTGSVNFGVLGTSALSALVNLNANYDVMQTDNQEITLSPNEQLTVAANALVQNILISIMWRERFLEESERL